MILINLRHPANRNAIAQDLDPVLAPVGAPQDDE